MSLDLKWVSCRQHLFGSCFCIHSASLCLLFGAFNPFAFKVIIYTYGLPGSSAGEESTCNAGDPGATPGSGRSPGEEIGYPLQYSWASLMAQMVKNPPAVWQTWVQSLGWQDHLEEGKATHFSILTWRIPMDSGACRATVHGVTKNRTWLSDFHFTSLTIANSQ